jgi:asparagine synthase (glutamine-hydrolysing)
MVAALGHRGPDGRGSVVCAAADQGSSGPTVVLGHTRLAILDLSDRAAQPMSAASGAVWITYNGEVYNFEALRTELQRLGRTFRSGSDTEVVLQAYDAWGPAMVERLRGMFAFAIWDGRLGELWLARDRFGIKPLYVYERDGVLLFASEVRALVSSGLVPRRLDRDGVARYLAYQTTPTPGTLLEGVRLLPPGHLARAREPGTTVERRYWDLLDARTAAAQGTALAEARAEVRRHLSEATRLHLVSDVPVGVFLSGGIDSSALVALTKDAGVTPRTYTVVLPGTQHDEARFARAVAARFDAEHTEIVLGRDELRSDLQQALEAVDHPSGDAMNTFFVSRAVRRAGVKVALSGLGGDELFGGYPSFRRMRRLGTYGRLWRRSPAGVRAAAATLVRAIGRSSSASEKAAALIETDATVPKSVPVLRQLFPARMRRALLDPACVERVEAAGDPYVELLEDAARRHPDAGPMALVAYAEARTYMHDVLLRDTDQMSMAHGLEVRVPLLDHELAEYVMGLPEALRAPGPAPKRLLVESLGSDLPAECVRRPKQGFVLPFDEWMRADLRGFCEERLGPRGLAGRGLFRPEAVASLWRSFLERDGRTTWSRPWALVALDAWIDSNGVSV